MSVVIQVENLSKYYRLGLIGGGTLRDDLNRWWAKARGRPDPLLKIGETDHGNRVGGELWALRDVSFQVREGEILGKKKAKIDRKLDEIMDFPELARFAK